MQRETFVGILGTVRHQSEGRFRHFDGEAPPFWDVIPEIKIRNGGAMSAALVAGYVYQLRYDAIGWHLSSEGGDLPQYLFDTSLKPIHKLQLINGPLVLMRDRYYRLSQNEIDGAWRVYEHPESGTP